MSALERLSSILRFYSADSLAKAPTLAAGVNRYFERFFAASGDSAAA